MPPRPRECRDGADLISQLSTMAQELSESGSSLPRLVNGMGEETDICKPLQVCAGAHQI